jgi:hypothetical protein
MTTDTTTQSPPVAASEPCRPAPSREEAHPGEPLDRLPAHDTRERSDTYQGEIIRSGTLRVAVCRDGIQFLLQRRRKRSKRAPRPRGTASATVPAGRRSCACGGRTRVRDGQTCWRCCPSASRAPRGRWPCLAA